MNSKVKYVVDHFTNSANYYNPMRTKIKDWDWLFYGIRDNPKYDWMSNIADNTTYTAIMTVLSRTMNTTFSVNPPFDVFGREESDEEFAPVIKNLIKYQFENNDLYHKYMMFVLQALIRGTSIGKIYWKKETQEKTYRKPITAPIEEPVINPMTGEQVVRDSIPMSKQVGEEIIGYTKDKKTITTYDDPWFEVLDIRDVYPEPGIVDVNDGAMIHRSYKSLDEIKKLRKRTLDDGRTTGLYENVDDINISETPPGHGQWGDRHPRLSEQIDLSPPDGVQVNHSDKKKNKLHKPVEILEAQCKYDIDNDGKLEDCIITVANRKTLLRAVENPFYHNDSMYVKIAYEPVLNEFYGRGICEVVEDEQEEINDKRNQRLDNINLVLQPVMQYVEGLVHPAVMKNFRFKPGGKMPVRDINATKWDRPPDVTLGVHKEIQDLKNDVQESSGATKSIMPAQGGEIHRTAAGMMMLQNVAGERLKPKVEMMENQGLKKIVERFHQLNQQFIGEEKVIRILGQDGLNYPKISPEDLQHNFDFIPAGSKEIANKQMQIMQVMRFLEIASKIPKFNAALNYSKIGEDLTELFGFQNKGWIKSPQQVQKVLRQERMQNMMQEMMKKGAGGSQGAKGAESPQRQQPPIQQMSGEGAGMDNIRQMLSKNRGGM